MKAISLTQPWAQAIFLDLKHYETRSWKTDYRGKLAIHAAKDFPTYAKEFAQTELALGRGVKRLPFGVIIGWVILEHVYQTYVVANSITPIERLYGDYSSNRYAWELTNPVLLSEPIPYRGSLGLFYVPDEIL